MYIHIHTYVQKYTSKHPHIHTSKHTYLDMFLRIFQSCLPVSIVQKPSNRCEYQIRGAQLAHRWGTACPRIAELWPASLFRRAWADTRFCSRWSVWSPSGACLRTVWLHIGTDRPWCAPQESVSPEGHPRSPCFGTGRSPCSHRTLHLEQVQTSAWNGLYQRTTGRVLWIDFLCSGGVMCGGVEWCGAIRCVICACGKCATGANSEYEQCFQLILYTFEAKQNIKQDKVQ